MTLWNDQQNRFGVLCGPYFLRQWSPPMRQRAFLCETVTRDCLRLGRIYSFSRIYVMPSLSSLPPTRPVRWIPIISAPSMVA